MTRSVALLVAFGTALWLGSFPVFAQHGGGPGGHAVGGPGAPSAARGPAMPDGGGRGSAPGASTQPSSMGQKKTVGDLLTQNTELSSNLQGLLPPGTDLQAAAGGFKNLGMFVAALHVSHNLGISFDDLKTKIVGGDSLGKAIHELNPTVDAKAEAKKAKKQAQDDMKA